jgi:flagellar motor switch protein FliN/FliY
MVASEPGEELPASEENIALKALSTADGEKGSLEINIDSLMNVPVTLSVEIGKTKIPIRQLIALNKGSLVELDKLVDEPLDLLVNGTLLARGEVVVVGGSFGLRLVDIVSQSERLGKLV